MKFSVLVLVTLIGFSGYSQIRMGLNDLTYLLPLPSVEQIPALLQTRSAGVRGELLPYSIYQKLPRIVPNLDPAALYQQSWKVVAIRLDPCFMETVRRNGCQPQIRLVWQPIVIKEYTVATVDASIHTFYDVPPSEWQQFLQAYSRLRGVRSRDVSQMPLQVSPQIVSTGGYQGVYWREFSKLILDYAGERNLSRLTFMNVNPMGNMWVFAGYHVVNGALVLMKIPGIDKNAQAVTAKRIASAETFLGVTPRPGGHDHYFTFAADSETAKKTWTQEQIQTAVRAAAEIENPLRHNSGTVSCASCHVSRSVSFLARGSFPKWDWNQILKGIVYTGSMNTTNTTTTFIRSDSLRMLGYFDRTPVISDRVIHDTDLSIRQLGTINSGVARAR